jgi:hypothetical protein
MKRFLIDSSVLVGAKRHYFQTLRQIEVQKKAKQQAFKELLSSAKASINENVIERALGMAEGSYDFFLSYSHDDMAEAELLYQELSSRGLNVFADYLYWGNADDFLKNWIEEETKYETPIGAEKDIKMNSTINVILETMLSKVLSNSKAFIFLKPNNAWSRMSKQFETYSPWVYHEIFTAELINKMDTSTEIKECFSESLHTNVAFTLDTSAYVTITDNIWQQITSLSEDPELKNKVLEILGCDDRKTV